MYLTLNYIIEFYITNYIVVNFSSNMLIIICTLLVTAFVTEVVMNEYKHGN